MLDGVEVGGCVIGLYSAFVVAQHHVHNPVQTVTRHPNDPEQTCLLPPLESAGRSRRNGSPVGFVLDFTEAFNHDNRLQY